MDFGTEMLIQTEANARAFPAGDESYSFWTIATTFADH